MLVLSLFVTFCLISDVHLWDSDEMRMFDLVEEVKRNFYDYLDVSQSASATEIKKAYRKLSVKLHPDKNINNPNAEVEFRQLVAIYEILKDDEMRKRYDEILQNGLPDWKMPVFYFRKLRKMSNYELFSLSFILATTIHFLSLYGSVFEKRWTFEDHLSKSLKLHKAKDRKRLTIETEIAEQLKSIPYPGFKDILPFAIVRWTYNFITFIPIFLKLCLINAYEVIMEHYRKRKERNQDKIRFKRKEDKKVKSRQQPELASVDSDKNVINSFFHDLPILPDDSKSNIKVYEEREWSESDVNQLVRLVTKYPPGVIGRWDKISEAMQRSIPEITAKVKSFKEHGLNAAVDNYELSSAFEVNVNPVCDESDTSESDELDDSGAAKSQTTIDEESESGELRMVNGEHATTAEVDEDMEFMSRKKLKERKLQDSRKYNTTVQALSSDGWSQAEQKQLEVAIKSTPKGTSDRWDRISECVPTKSKAEIMTRVKLLSSIAKKK